MNILFGLLFHKMTEHKIKKSTTNQKKTEPSKDIKVNYNKHVENNLQKN